MYFYKDTIQNLRMGKYLFQQKLVNAICTHHLNTEMIKLLLVTSPFVIYNPVWQFVTHWAKTQLLYVVCCIIINSIEIHRIKVCTAKLILYMFKIASVLKEEKLEYKYISQFTVQYRPVITAHTREIFRVVPLVFIAWVKSKSMHGFDPQPLVVLSVVISIIMRV